MNRRTFLRTSVATTALGVLPRKLRAQGIQSGIMSPVLTRAADNTRSGSYTSETIFTQANVKTQGLRRYFQLWMEGDARGCEAQPLVMPKVAMDDGTTRDVVVVCSMNGLVWCYDANDSDILWVKKLAPPVKGSRAIDGWGINDWWGILSTPIIDPDSQTLYAVSWTSPDGTPGKGMHAVHSLRLKDGSRVNPPCSLANVSYKFPNNAGTQKYSSTMRKQRSSLCFATIGGKKTVFFACGTVQETIGGAAGWIVAYDVDSNTIAAALPLTNGYGAGIWMAGGGLCCDGTFLYGVTGNGSFAPPIDFGECAVKVKYTPAGATGNASLEVVQWFAPFSDAGRQGEDPTKSAPASVLNEKLAGISAPTSMGHMPVTGMADMDAQGKVVGMHLEANVKKQDAAWGDEDLGSAGCVLIPKFNLLIVSGKDGVGYVLDATNLGNNRPADFANIAKVKAMAKQVVFLTFFPGFNVNPMPQDQTQMNFDFNGKTRHMHSTPVVFESPVHGTMLFCWGENSVCRVWTVSASGLKFLAQGQEIASANVPQNPGGMPGGFMCLSANGSTKGTALLWATVPYGDANKTVTNGRLLVYDAENFGQNPDGTARLMPLWDSQQWNIQFTYNKFCPPTISGGKLFLATYADTVDVYGLA